MQNIDISVAYTGYTRFNGAASNYDGANRNASDNNTVYMALWVNFRRQHGAPHDRHGAFAAQPEPITRRSFFVVLLGIGTAGMGALLAVPVLRFVLYPLYAKTRRVEWSHAGAFDEFSNLKQPLRRTLDITQRDGW